MPLNPPQGYRKTEFTHRYGLAADKPAAADVLIGTFYISSDTGTFERSNGTTWDAISSGGGSGSDHVVMSDGGIPVPEPLNDGAGNFIYVPY